MSPAARGADSLEEVCSALLPSLRGSDLSALAYDYADLGLDKIFGSRSVQQIPVFRTLATFMSVGSELRNLFFRKKLLRFLLEFRDVPREDRERQISKLIVDPNEQRRVAEHLTLVLDRLNNMEKAPLIARSFLIYLEGRLNRSEMIALNHSIDHLEMEALPALEAFFDASDAHDPDRPTLAEIGVEWQTHLAMCGFLRIKPDLFGSIRSNQPAVVFIASELGKKFVRIILRREKGASSI